MKQDLERIFAETVPVVFSFLVSEYGFKIKEKKSWLFYATSPKCVIAIFVDYGDQLSVTLKYPAKEQPSASDELGGVDVTIIAKCIEPGVSIRSQELLSLEAVHSELGKYAELVKNYCVPFLKGDWSTWSNIEECLRRRFEK